MTPLRVLGRPAAILFILGTLASIYVALSVDRVWIGQKTTYSVYTNDQGQLAYQFRGDERLVGDVVAIEDSALNDAALAGADHAGPSVREQWVVESVGPLPSDRQYALLQARYHYGLWSLLPAALTIALCLITREPLSALFVGIVAGGFMLGRFDITDSVLLPNLASTNAATILLLYLWLVGGLTGIWSRTGAAQAFAEMMTRRLVRGPRSAKLVCWLLGILFFQGGSISVVLVGTIVKPVADRERISHEELAYIVDSTASPIASVIAFNAWPAYVQALIFVPGVAVLATESDRISFFFSSVPLSFYGILAVISTLLLSLDITRFAGPELRRARERARTTGELDRPGAMPMSAKELQTTQVPDNYQPHVAEFIVPLAALIGVAVGTFIWIDSPKVNWAFGAALAISIGAAMLKGMSLRDVIAGIGDGLKGVVLASVVLMLAVTIGALSQEIGAGLYLVELLGERIPYWALPISLLLITMIVAFATGTSWGTYAIAFPLAMPLAWSVAQAQGLENPVLYLSICFATVLNGSVYGDQCSPISDTTILSSMTTGCDLMDHVRTQIVPATYAMTAAATLWTIATLIAR